MYNCAFHELRKQTSVLLSAFQIIFLWVANRENLFHGIIQCLCLCSGKPGHHAQSVPVRLMISAGLWIIVEHDVGTLASFVREIISIIFPVRYHGAETPCAPSPILRTWYRNRSQNAPVCRNNHPSYRPPIARIPPRSLTLPYYLHHLPSPQTEVLGNRITRLDSR
jgi:hypothetical protein